MVLVAQDHCREALHDALAIEMKHKRAMQMFNDCHKMCHKIYDHKAVPVGDIDKLGKK